MSHNSEHYAQKVQKIHKSAGKTLNELVSEFNGF